MLDNGAIAKSVHGGLKREPGSINYEVYGTKGMMETERFDGARLTVYREGEQLCKGDLSTYVPEKFVSPIWWRPAAWAAITAAIFTPPTFSLKRFWAARTALTAWTCTRRWTWGFAGYWLSAPS